MGVFHWGKICIKQKGWAKTWFKSDSQGEFSIILAGAISMNPSMPYPIKSLTGVYVLLSAIIGSIIMKESDWFIKWFIERKDTAVKQTKDPL